MRWLVALACAACSSDAAVSDASHDAAFTCAAVFTGNFAETATTAEPCATFESGRFALKVTTPGLNDGLVVMIPVAGTSASSQTTAGWSVTATRTVDHSNCVLDAGDGVVPHGSFELPDASHGTLVLDLPVRAEALANCGDPLTEHVEVAF